MEQLIEKIKNDKVYSNAFEIRHYHEQFNCIDLFYDIEMSDREYSRLINDLQRLLEVEYIEEIKSKRRVIADNYMTNRYVYNAWNDSNENSYCLTFFINGNEPEQKITIRIEKGEQTNDNN